MVVMTLDIFRSGWHGGYLVDSCFLYNNCIVKREISPYNMNSDVNKIQTRPLENLNSLC